MFKRETPATVSNTEPFDINAMIERYEKTGAFNPELIVDTLRSEGREAMADLVEGMYDRIQELELKLSKAVKNRPPRHLTHKKP